MNAYGRRAPAAAARFAPSDPRPAMAQAMLELRSKGGRVSPGATAAAVAALGDAPLAEDPFLIAGLSRLVAEQPAEAAPLLAEAKRRNPRSRVARLLLLDRYLRTGQTERAVVEIAALGRLIPEANRVLIPELARFAVQPQSGAAVGDLLRSDPQLRGGVLQHMASAGTAPPEAVLQLAERSGALRERDAPWQTAMLQNLVKRNALSEARELWERFAGPQAQAGLVYDPGFRRLPGAPPFNWTFASEGGGVAEPAGGGALQVEYYARQEAELASQLLMLPPGRYRLAFRASGNTPGTSAAVSWRVSCHPGSNEIAAAPVAKLNASPAPLSTSFVVPPGACPAQWLKLVGTPSEFPAAHSITLSELRIARAGS